MKIIFLDIDGVLNSQEWYAKRHKMILDGKLTHSKINDEYPYWDFSPKLINNLNKIIYQTNAKVVVSSTWRVGRSVEDLQQILDNVGFIGEVIGKTPKLSFNPNTLNDSYSHLSVPRGCEIEWWLKNEGNFQRINWSREKQEEVLAESKVKNYIILDDDSDMLYGQREHFVKTYTHNGLGDHQTALSIKILNTPLVDIYYKES